MFRTFRPQEFAAAEPKRRAAPTDGAAKKQKTDGAAASSSATTPDAQLAEEPHHPLQEWQDPLRELQDGIESEIHRIRQYVAKVSTRASELPDKCIRRLRELNDLLAHTWDDLGVENSLYPYCDGCNRQGGPHPGQRQHMGPGGCLCPHSDADDETDCEEHTDCCQHCEGSQGQDTDEEDMALVDEPVTCDECGNTWDGLAQCKCKR